MDAGSLLNIVGSIYDAPPVGDWRPSLELVDGLLDCTRAVLMTDDRANGRHSPVASRDPEVEASYVAQYMPLNDAWPSLARQDIGRAVLERQVLDMQRYETGVFYNEFARPNLMVAASGIVIDRDGDVTSALILNHAERSDDQEKTDLRALSLLQPHYRRAALLWQGRSALAQGELSLWEAADRFPTGLIIVDHCGTVLRHNTAAAEFLRLQRAAILERRPFAGPDMLRADILTALRRSLKPDRGAAAPGGHRLQIRDRAYALTLLPLQGPPEWVGTRRTCYLVAVSDLAAAPAGARDTLIATFGLTMAEARLAIALGGAGTLGDVADSLGVQLSTVKTLLSRALGKTGLHSQSQLVRLVERLSLIGPATPGAATLKPHQ